MLERIVGGLGSELPLLIERAGYVKRKNITFPSRKFEMENKRIGMVICHIRLRHKDIHRLTHIKDNETVVAEIQKFDFSKIISKLNQYLMECRLEKVE